MPWTRAVRSVFLVSLLAALPLVLSCGSNTSPANPVCSISATALTFGTVNLGQSVDRTFTVAGQPLNVFAGVQNLTNRRNVASYNWNRRTNSQSTGEQQGIFPILGLDWRF